MEMNGITVYIKEKDIPDIKIISPDNNSEIEYGEKFNVKTNIEKDSDIFETHTISFEIWTYDAKHELKKFKADKNHMVFRIDRGDVPEGYSELRIMVKLMKKSESETLEREKVVSSHEIKG